MDILYQYNSRSFVLWQAGGVRIDGGEVTFTGCNIYENTAYWVRPSNLSIAPMDKC